MNGMVVALSSAHRLSAREVTLMLHYPLRSFSAATSFVLLLSSCTALTGKTASQNVDDATITASVKTKLATQ
jgi:hypothetical protein